MPHRGDCRKDGPGDPYYCLKKGVGIGKAKATRKVVKKGISKREAKTVSEGITYTTGTTKYGIGRRKGKK